MAQRNWTPSQETILNMRDKMLLVSAAAGSGKTSVLTERIIRLLTEEGSQADLSRILVVTFTRAAAAELKSRIAQALTAALAERPGDTHLSKQLFLLGSAQISTIDAFFQKTVRDHFDELGLPASFRLADQGEINEICLRVLDDTIRDCYARYDTNESTEALSPFARLRGNRFATAMNDLMNNRGEMDFDAKLLRFYEKFSSYPQGIQLLQDYSVQLQEASNQEFFVSPPGKVLRRYLQDAAAYFLTQLQAVKSYLDVDPDCAAKFSGVYESDTTLFSALQVALDQGSFENTRRIIMGFQKTNFPIMRNKPREMERYKDLRTQIKDAMADWQERFFQFSQIEIKSQILRNADLCEMLHQLFSEYSDRVWEEKKRRGVLDFNDVRERLYRLLTLPNGHPSPVAEALAEQYDAVYIDEYQDVDFMQDRIFALIGKNRRFMVGDIKQSIYGFRGSEPSIFADYRRSMPLHTQKEAEGADRVCVFMSDNFRCNEPVIDYANRVCSFLFSGCEDSVGYRPEDDLQFKKGRDNGLEPAIPVQTVIFEGYPRAKKGETSERDEERPNREAVWVASEIEYLLRNGKLDNGAPIAPSDIAILVRNANLGIPFVKELEKLGIPVASTAGDDIAHTPLMTDLLNLLRCIDNPHRDLPLSEYLVSRNGGFTLEELSVIRSASEEKKSLYDAVCFAAEDESFPIREKCKAWVAWLEGFRKLAAVQPADRFLRLLYADPRLNSYSGEAELLVLYEQARVYQRNAWCGLYGFLQHFDHVMESGSVSTGAFKKADSAVRVMTMHTSKGLEYPVVFLCSCEKKFNTKSLDEMLLFHRKMPAAARLFDAETVSNESGILREISKLEIQADEAEENIRLLYVALTRARERLYITGTPDGNYDTLMSHAEQFLRGSRYSILYNGNFLRWILGSLRERTAENRDDSIPIRYISLSDELRMATPMQSEPQAFRANEPNDNDGDVYGQFQRVLSAKQDFLYPLEGLNDVPTKIAASKIRSDLLDHLMNDEEFEETLRVQMELMQSATPAFESILNRKKQVGATEIGTAIHSFLEFCNLKHLPKVGIKAEIDRLVKQQFLLSETAEMLNLEQLESFIKSDLMSLLQEAEEIYREQRFSLPIPISTLTTLEKTSHIYQNQTIFVQGSIDLLLRMKDGKLILFDYKTDRVTSEEKNSQALLTQNMIKKHGDQLSCYAKAVKELFGQAPDQVYIYSFPLGESVLIPADPEKF